MVEIDFSRMIIHDSAKPKYRWPAGAVPQGTKIALCLEIRDITVEEVYLEVLRGVEKESIRMEHGGVDWATEYDVPCEPCVLWYWFVIKLDDNNKIYYGADVGRNCGTGRAYWRLPPAFQLTVYEKDFMTPGWMKEAVMYQIFPDRFARGNEAQAKTGLEYHKKLGRPVIYHEDWNELPLYKAAEGMDCYQPCDYYGGDLQGVLSKLDYLHDLGVTVIYLNPITEANSNHRYNTSDYLKVDPVLGTEEDFRELVEAARERGIRIILDGVFSHTGDDSVYFNKYGNYDGVGAYQSKDSPYYNWYRFTDYPDKYSSWWGFDTLPEINEKEQSWIDFVIEKEDSVLATWLGRGAAGFRLDVADELPDETIAQMRNAIKYIGQDNALIGEVWENATTKESHGENRKYALGGGLDSVSNYPLKDEIIRFILHNIDADEFKNFLVAQHENYPKEMYYSLMNLLSNHDIARIRSVFSTTVNPTELSREEQAHLVVTPAQEKEGAARQKMAVALQFTLPGMPCVYYGDEVGMMGMFDPFNRQAYEVRDDEMREFHAQLAALRRKNDCLRTGHCLFATHSANTIGILRYCFRGKDAFGNVAEDGMFLTLVNRAETKETVVVDLFSEEQIQTEEELEYLKGVDFDSAVCALTGEAFPIRNGLIELEMEKQSVRILELIWI